MPAVGMRKSTRVFGTRVLRSGRRLSTEPREGNKYSKLTSGESDWIGLVDNKLDEGGGGGGNTVSHMPSQYERKYVKRKVGRVANGTLKAVSAVPKVVNAEPVIDEPVIDETVSGGVDEIKDRSLMFGVVYTRKRKRTVLPDTGLLEDQRFRKKYARKQWRKKLRESEPLEVCEDACSTLSKGPGLSILARDSSFTSCYWMTRVLTSVLSYMMKIRLDTQKLSDFLLSKTIFDAYYSHGVLFVQGSKNISSNGVCVISGSRSLIPIFSVDFSAIPVCFVHMHTSLYIRSLFLFSFATHAPGTEEKGEEFMGLEVEMTDVVDFSTEPLSEIPFDGYHSDVVVALPLPTFPEGDVLGDEMIGTAKNKSKGKELAHPAVSLRKYSLRSSLQFRNSRNIQKRRTSRRRKRGRPTPIFRAQKDSGALSADFLRIRNVSTHIPSAAPNRTLRSLVNRDFTADSSKALKSNMGVLKQGLRTNSCSTNLLIIEPDRGYRVGATIVLEQSGTKGWVLAVKINGINHYTLTAHKVMRPPGSNRFTHATVWSGDGSWKLEFPDKQDWFIFKELYKECSDRNIQAPAASVIPIPRVQEVSLNDNSNHAPFLRPTSYITVKEDELTRALGKKVANYDMDSEDEEWLNKFNEEMFAEGHLQQLTHERFELIIDAFERSMHCPGDEYSNEHAAEDIFTPIEPVRSYWMKKRKQKHCSVIRIFQLYQLRRNPVISKPILRKKRSFKRQPSHGGRGKQRNFLQAIAEERKAREQPNYVQNVEEAKAAADRSEELAVLKRLRAQKLMENADLATYKAVIALRIAEAAQVADSPSTVASFFLG